LALTEEHLGFTRALGDKDGVAISLYNLAVAVMRQGDPTKAAAFFAEVVGISDEIGDRRLKAFGLWSMATAEAERPGNVDRARVAALAAESVRLLQQLAIRSETFFEIFEEVAGWAVEAADHARAARLLGATSSLRLEFGADGTRDPDSQASYDANDAAVRRALDDAFEKEWAAGQALSLEGLFAEAQAALAAWGARPGRAEPATQPAIDLTSREREVLGLIAEGRTDREIAALHGVSARTVSVNVGRILAKLGATTRAAAVATAIRRGLI
jgi:DNA-binding CsgD family transcriptional regulator